MAQNLEHNDPFYFALPRGASRGDVSKAANHIRAVYGVEGRPEVVRVGGDMALCRVVDRVQRSVTRPRQRTDTEVTTWDASPPSWLS